MASTTSRKSQAKTTNPDHDEHGHFTKGNRGGPGNPFNRRLAELREAALSVITEEQMQELFKVIYTQAILGDKASQKMIVQYVIGKPASSVNPDRMEEDDWERRKRRPDGPEMEETVNRMDHGIANAIAVGHDVMHEQQMEEELKKDTKKEDSQKADPQGSKTRPGACVDAPSSKPQAAPKFDWRDFDPEEWEPSGHVIDEVLREEWARRHRKNGKAQNGKAKKLPSRNGVNGHS